MELNGPADIGRWHREARGLPRHQTIGGDLPAQYGGEAVRTVAVMRAQPFLQKRLHRFAKDGPMDTLTRHREHPLLGHGVQAVPTGKLPPHHETALDVLDARFHLALRLRPVGPTQTRREAIIVGEILALRRASGPIETGVLVGTPGAYRLTKALPSLQVPATERRCAEGTTLIHVEAAMKDASRLVSNDMFLVNLKYMGSGRSQRRERRIREAQRSASQFAAILDELLQLDDTDAPKTFLTHCDIPLIDAARPHVFRGARLQWEATDVWRTLGDRNLREYASLHDAAMGFCERHLRKMLRHCKRASITAIPNFMHIALAMGNVLSAQVERVLIGLETTRSPLSADAWHEHRQRLEKYLMTFRNVVATLDKYASALQKRFKETAIREAIRPDLEPLTKLCGSFLEVRDRVDACRRVTLQVRVVTGNLVVPPIFPHDLLGASRWFDWSRAIHACADRSTTWLEATASVSDPNDFITRR